MNTKQQWNKIYDVIDDEYFEQSNVKFTKEFLIKCKKQFNETHFIPVEVKKKQQVGLEHGLLSHIFQIKHRIISETDKFPKRKNPNFKFEGQ